MTWRADSTASALSILVDQVASPAAADVQGVKIIDGTTSSGLAAPADTHGLYTQAGNPVTPTVTSVGASLTSVVLIALAGTPASRRGVTVYNNSTSAMFLKLGATASSASFTIRLGGTTGSFTIGTYYEVPFGYAGAIAGIWDVAVGAALITEVTW